MIDKSKLKVLPTSKLAAQYLANQLAELLVKLTETQRYVNVAVSGGTTPAILFSYLAEKYHDIINWRKVNFFWVDERCVAPNHEDSNYLMTSNALFKKIEISKGNIHRMMGENDPEKEAKRYGNYISLIMPEKIDLPQFDVILLGMGDDGHTASIFPDNLSLLENTDVCAVAEHPVSKQKRITLTGPVICNSLNIFFLVTGKSKFPAMNEILSQTEKARHYPAYFIQNAIWVVDEDAVKEV